MTTTSQQAGRGAALVTGAGLRIGRAIALDLARAGFRVAVHSFTSQGPAEEVAQAIRRAGGTAATFAADLADADQLAPLVDAAAAALGPLTSLVNNASLFLDDRIETMRVADWDRQQAINLRAPVLLARRFAEILPEGRQGTVVNIIDQRVLRPTPEYFSYAVTKHALLAATRMLAQALAPRVRVNGVGPGPVLKSIHQSDAEFAAEAGATLLGHGASPEEIAAAVRFLLDQPAVTGQMIAVDGGQHLVWQGSPG